MLNALLSQPLFLVISLACHLLFQYTCWVWHVLTFAITTSSRARSVWGVFRGYSGLLGVHFPHSATCGVGVSAARINANWNAYLFIFMTFGLGCNKFNFGTLWHCFCYSPLSSYVCNLILAHIWLFARFYSFKTRRDKVVSELCWLLDVSLDSNGR